MTNRPSHFEIPVDDPDRAERFYGAVFGWTFRRYEGAPSYYGLADTGQGEPGINGALFQRSPESSQVTLTMDVESIEAALEKVEAAGGQVIQGKMPIPSMGWFATCRDPEGNTFGLYTDDPSAG
jgi:predicted enzyme related to lactoylglutathione lyase